MNEDSNYIELSRIVASDLRLSGYYAIYDSKFTESDSDVMRKLLFSEFNKLLYVEVDDSRKYFISDKSGLKIVIRILENKAYKLKRSIINLQREHYYIKDHEKEMERICNLIKQLEIEF